LAPNHIVAFDGQIELEALRLFGLPEAAPAVLYACPSVPVGTREFQAEVSWDLPSLASGATALTDVTVSGSRQGDMAQASLVSSTRFIDLTAFAWTNNTVRVMARNISGATVVRLVGAILLEQSDEWATQRARYMTLEAISTVSDTATVRLSAVPA